MPSGSDSSAVAQFWRLNLSLTTAAPAVFPSDSLKVMTNKKRGWFTVILFDRSQTNLFNPHPVKGLKLLSEPYFYCLQTLIVSQ